jgi:hypothetical protein
LKYLSFFFLFFFSAITYGQVNDIHNTLNLFFLADGIAQKIEIIDINTEESIYVIETDKSIHEVFATPFAPVLIFSSLEDSSINFIDLRSMEVAKELILNSPPMHGVLDPSGTKIAFTNSLDGGFEYISAYSGERIFSLDDFPATGPILFDVNQVELYFSSINDNWIGFLDLNTKRYSEIDLPLSGQSAFELSSPSRSMDGRYIYIANTSSGEVYVLNAFSKIIFKAFYVGSQPVRPYSTPEGSFLYIVDEASGKFISVDQNQFNTFYEGMVPPGTNLIAVGRFDRYNLFLSTHTKNYAIFDNVRQRVTDQGMLEGTPVAVYGTVDGRSAYIAFKDHKDMVKLSFENQEIAAISTNLNSVTAMTVGMSNNVCH